MTVRWAAVAGAVLAVLAAAEVILTDAPSATTILAGCALVVAGAALGGTSHSIAGSGAGVTSRLTLATIASTVALVIAPLDGPIMLTALLAMTVIAAALGWGAITWAAWANVSVLTAGAIMAAVLDPSVEMSAATQPVLVAVVACATAALARRDVERRMEVSRLRQASQRSGDREAVMLAVHDVTAHGLMGVLTQIRVGRTLLDVRDHSADHSADHAADHALAEAESAAREAIETLRSIPDTATKGESGPPPSTLHRQAVESLRFYPEVSLEWGLPDGRAVPRPAGGVLIAAVRQAVANAAAHAPGQPLALTVSQRDGRLRFTARNDRAAAATAVDHPLRSAGQGLEGLLARAEAVGGSLTVAADDEQFTLAVDLPLGDG